MADRGRGGARAPGPLHHRHPLLEDVRLGEAGVPARRHQHHPAEAEGVCVCVCVRVRAQCTALHSSWKEFPVEPVKVL